MADGYAFGQYRLDVAGRVLTCDGHVVPLPPKAFELLLLMAERPGRAFSKHELMTALWPATFVEEANLSFQVSVLRKALGEGGASWVETVPKHGYRFAADVKRVPERTGAVPAVTMARPVGGAVTAATRTRWVAALAIVLVMAAAAGFLHFRARRSELVRPASTVAVPLTAYPGFENHPSLSPDGSQVAFSWNGSGQDNYDIYVKLVGSGPPLRLTTDPAHENSPAWSPDGRFIAFQRFIAESVADVFVVPALGGAERRVAAAVYGHSRFGAAPAATGNLTWSPDGRWLALGRRFPPEERGVWLIAVDGSEKRRLTDSIDWRPSFSPDGRYLAFLRQEWPHVGVNVLPLSPAMTAPDVPRRVTPKLVWVLGLAWIPDGRSLVFSSSGYLGQSRLQRVSFGPDPLTVFGTPEPLPYGEQATAVTVSRTGRLVYSAQFRDTNLWKIFLDGQPRLAAAPLAASTLDDHVPEYSPDGKRLCFSSTRSGVEELWISDASGSNPQQATTSGGMQSANARWSRDGQTIAFNSRRDGMSDLFLLDPGTGEVRPITDDPSEDSEPRWSRDGGTIYFASNRTGRFEGWKMPAGGGEAVRVTANGGMSLAESPDGRFLYYAKDALSPTSIWRVPVGGGAETKIADGLSCSTNFVVADRGLYFLAVGDASDKTSIDFYEFETGKRTTLLRLGKQWWYGMALAPDQRSILISTVDSAGSNLMVVDRIQ